MRRRRRSRLWAVLAAPIALGTVVLLSATHAIAGGGDDAETLLERARDASTDQTFAGVVDVYWRDDQGEHTVRVAARSASGAFVVGGGHDRVVGSGALRWVGHGDVGETGWRVPGGRAAPEPGAAWDLALHGSAHIAGRRAVVVTASDADGNVRARFAVDRETGQLLRREVLDRHGRVARSVGFERIAAIGEAPFLPALPPANAPVPKVVADVPDGFVAPDVVDGGYRLLGRYERSDGAVQLYYGDGLFAVSVFEQSGAVDWGSLPRGGRSTRVAGIRTQSYETAEGTVVVWGDDGLVLTGIADGPPGTADTVVASLSGDDDGGLLRDIADFVLDPFSWE